MSHHFATREEELFTIGVVSFERLTTLLRQRVKGGFEDVALVEVRSIVAGVSTFMLDVLDVVNSPAESAKCVHTRNEQESEAPAQNWVNRIVRSCKLDSSVASAPTTVRGTVGSSEGVLPAKWRLTRGEGQGP
jgi:hypothetical protein